MVPTGQAAEKQACEDPRQDRELKSWRCLVFYLCFFGFMAQLRPGESFITPYLLQHNFTITQACCHWRVGEWWCGLGVLSWFDIYLQLRLRETKAGETELVHPNPPPALVSTQRYLALIC